MNRLTPKQVTDAMIENIYRRNYALPQAIVLPPRINRPLMHIEQPPVRSYPQDRVVDRQASFAAKIRQRNKRRRIQNVLGGRAMDSDIA